jgi:hypothetical protein
MTLGEASLLEQLTADEESVRGQLESLREQVAALEERLSDLATARRIVAPMRCGDSRTPGSAGGPGKPTESNPGRAPRSDPTTWPKPW